MKLLIFKRIQGLRTVFFLFLLSFPYLFVQTNPVFPQEARAPAQENSSEASDLTLSLQDQRKLEQRNMELLKEELAKAQRTGKDLEVEIDTYLVKGSAFRNLLLNPSVQVSDLRKLQANTSSLLTEINHRITLMREDQKVFLEMRRQTEEQVLASENQLALLQSRGAARPETEPILSHLQEFREILSSKRLLLETIGQSYSDYTLQLGSLQKDFADLSGKIARQILERQNRELFERRISPLVSVEWGELYGVFAETRSQVGRLLSIAYWEEKGREIWRTAHSTLISFLLLIAVTQGLLFRLRRKLKGSEKTGWTKRYPWGGMGLNLLQRSLPLLGIVLLIYGYAQAKQVYATLPLIQKATWILTVWLFTKWGLDFLKVWNDHQESKIPENLTRRLRRLLTYIRLFLIVYLLLEGLFDSTLPLLFWRVSFELLFLGWSLSFLKEIRGRSLNPVVPRSRGGEILNTALLGFGYILPGVGLFLELAGYGQLAFYWVISWGRTTVVLLWASLLFLFIRELSRREQQHSAEESSETVQPIHWFFIQISRLIWLGLLCVGVLFAWGATQEIIIDFFKIFGYPIPVGEMRFSLLGLIHAVLILLITSAAARLWRHVIKDRILEGSGLELGLKESITSITVYSLWALGILAALFAFGLSSTSLAVALGALGIGLGFGLQNIFNNFVSGLILLFERPIQVGDVVEIGGTWGKVVKINVRSTVVQTFDNASLIIPNSEFVSSQLTNWSFKDMRIRRNVLVGVAYGSDVEEVRRTLLEVADAHTQILKTPGPQVLFTDFADSALLFKLRFWTTIDFALGTETDIRFEIDRLFRERNIQIPFPQRDLHLVSGMEKFAKDSEEELEMESGSDSRRVAVSNPS
jgi:potassium-dependent mechanosensitive channel